MQPAQLQIDSSQQKKRKNVFTSYKTFVWPVWSVVYFLNHQPKIVSNENIKKSIIYTCIYTFFLCSSWLWICIPIQPLTRETCTWKGTLFIGSKIVYVIEALHFRWEGKIVCWRQTLLLAWSHVIQFTDPYVTIMSVIVDLTYIFCVYILFLCRQP